MDAAKDRERLSILREACLKHYEDAHIKRIREINNGYIAEFKEYLLKEKGISEELAIKHAKIIELFLNVYLPRENMFILFDFYEDLGGFFEGFLVYKCVSSVSEMTSAIASCNKFIDFLGEKGYFEEVDCKLAKDTIKEEKGYWLKELKKYRKEIFGS